MESLGIDLKLVIAQLINFGILFWLLSKFAYKPIMNLLEERQKKIEQGLADAAASAKKLADVESKTAKMLESTEKEAGKILADAKVTAKAEADEMIGKATDQAERTLKNAEKDAEAAKNSIVSEAKKELSGVVVMALDKIVGSQLDDEHKKKLSDKAIADL
jgi:F-type H+-transporting ATPase subunit b